MSSTHRFHSMNLAELKPVKTMVWSQLRRCAGAFRPFSFRRCHKNRIAVGSVATFEEEVYCASRTLHFSNDGLLLATPKLSQSLCGVTRQWSTGRAFASCGMILKQKTLLKSASSRWHSSPGKSAEYAFLWADGSIVWLPTVPSIDSNLNHVAGEESRRQMSHRRPAIRETPRHGKRFRVTWTRR